MDITVPVASTVYGAMEIEKYFIPDCTIVGNDSFLLSKWPRIYRHGKGSPRNRGSNCKNRLYAYGQNVEKP